MHVVELNAELQMLLGDVHDGDRRRNHDVAHTRPAAQRHRARSAPREDRVYYFIEKDEARAEHLKKVVDSWKGKVPASTTVHVVTGTFDGTTKEIFDYLDEQKKRLAPAFVMVDPFLHLAVPTRAHSRRARSGG